MFANLLLSLHPLQKLLKISEQSWSLAELVHAVVLLAHYHALASFAFGCGCEQDVCPEGRGLLKLVLPGSLCFCEAGNGGSQELLHLQRKRVRCLGTGGGRKELEDSPVEGGHLRVTGAQMLAFIWHFLSVQSTSQAFLTLPFQGHCRACSCYTHPAGGED